MNDTPTFEKWWDSQKVPQCRSNDIAKAFARAAWDAALRERDHLRKILDTERAAYHRKMEAIRRLLEEINRP